MATLYEGFDFSILDSPDFKEDAVREDLVVPLLKELGYSTTGKHKLIRSKNLVHPFVYIGTKKHQVYIIPDYLLQVNEHYQWVLDAKSPSENIREGKNVEQAFSYAIHKETRVNLYALCNGREFILFNISKVEPLIHFELFDIQYHWDELYRLVSPQGLINPKVLDFKPDFGLHLLQSGFTDNDVLYFPSVPVFFIVRIEDNLYSIMGNVRFEGQDYMASLDFDGERYQKLLELAPEKYRTLMTRSLSKQPYKLDISKEPFFIGIEAELGKGIHENENERYFPLFILDFSHGVVHINL